MKKVITFIFVIFMAGIILVPLIQAQFFFMLQNPLIGEKVPAFDVKTIKGKTVHSSDILTDDPSIIFFWATWCPHCRTALDELNQKRLQYRKDSVNIVLINLGETKQTVERYLKKSNIQMEVYLDQEQALGDTFSIMGLPTFCYIDAKGIIVEIGHELPDNYREIFYPSDS